jgi:sulfate/thiosulfate transport system ATP-binding protein
MGITVEGANKRFGDFQALKDVSISVPDGSLTALLGPSGSGKSTLLRAIAGLEDLDSGRVMINDEDATAKPAQKRGVGFVFQHYAAFKHMTVRDNVAFGLTIRKRPKPEIRARVDQLLELVQLQQFGHRYPAQLSGGQRQRMALARALAVEPEVLLLDEPFGALDARVRAELREWLRRLHEEVHVTTVFVTHDQEEAMEVADQIAVMNHGVIEQLGRPEEIYNRPRTEFVAGFIGVSNLMPGSVAAVNGQQVEVRLDSGPTVRASADGVVAGGRANIVVRPEKLHVSLVEEPADAGRPNVEGVVESAVYLGTATQMVVKLAGDVPLTVLVPNADEAERQRLPGAGARVRLSWALEHMHVVAAGGGQARAQPPEGDRQPDTVPTPV